MRVLIYTLFSSLLLANTLSARSMQCTYEFAGDTGITIFHLSEDRTSKDINVKFEKKDFLGNIERKDWKPFKKINENLYSDDGGLFHQLIYIDFQKVKMHVLQGPSGYLGRLLNNPNWGYKNKSVEITVPIIIWNCFRTD